MHFIIIFARDKMTEMAKAFTREDRDYEIVILFFGVNTAFGHEVPIDEPRLEKRIAQDCNISSSRVYQIVSKFRSEIKKRGNNDQKNFLLYFEARRRIWVRMRRARNQKT